MKCLSSVSSSAIVAAIIVAVSPTSVRVAPPTSSTSQAPRKLPGPTFQVDPFWPKPLPNDWLVGNVVGVAVDSHDNVWISHRPRSQTGAEKTPAVLSFDPAGNLIQSWGGKDTHPEWGTQEHGLYVDYKDNVWVGFGGGLPYDPTSKGTTDNAHVLKATRQGRVLLEIGKFGMGTEGSNSTRYLGNPTDVWVDAKSDEVYVSDGYINRRVIVFDANTGEFKRLWGAFGKKPDDTPMPRFNRSGPPRQQFDTPHCIVGTDDGLVYVCDRGNQRIQVFKHDGTFVKDAFVNTQLGDGRIGGNPWDMTLSKDKKLLFLVDGGTHRVHALLRDSLEVVSSFGRRGRWAGQFESPHSIASDSKGNLFVAETLDGRRVQKFVRRGNSSSR